ncbi:hypothetical protein BYT27DRAFT_7193171 [Phlegmacium glaucopus]|nr:hypothetical protein BYT27DRAFT_7193171 [Phlegmacium glaucopus]
MTAPPDVSEAVPLDLDNVTTLYFLNRLRSFVLDKWHRDPVTWDDVKNGSVMDLFSSDAGWSTFDEVLACEKFISPEEGCFGLVFRDGDEKESVIKIMSTFWDLNDIFTLPCINVLFPAFRESILEA